MNLKHWRNTDSELVTRLKDGQSISAPELLDWLVNSVHFKNWTDQNKLDYNHLHKAMLELGEYINDIAQ